MLFGAAPASDIKGGEFERFFTGIAGIADKTFIYLDKTPVFQRGDSDNSRAGVEGFGELFLRFPQGLSPGGCLFYPAEPFRDGIEQQALLPGKQAVTGGQRRVEIKSVD